MATTDTTAAKTAESGSDGEASRGTSSDGVKGTRRKLNDAQEREVTRLYAATETPVSEISKRFGIGESSVYRVAQRHGAALRGRTATSAKSTTRPAAKAAGRPPGTAGRGTRGRRAAGTATKTTAKSAAKTTAKTAAKSTAKTAAKSAAKTAAKSAAKTPSTNGRRTGAPRGRPAGTGTRRNAAAATRVVAKRGTRTRRAAAGAARREFRVSYVAVRVFVAATMADAIRQAEAAGATDITGIERR